MSLGGEPKGWSGAFAQSIRVRLTWAARRGGGLSEKGAIGEEGPVAWANRTCGQNDYLEVLGGSQ